MTTGRDIRLASERREVIVDLGRRSYSIFIGAGLLESAGALIKAHVPGRKAAIVADASVDALHGGRLRASLNEAKITNTTITVPSGEASKNFAQTERVCGAILEAGIERGDMVVAFGGGVIGDLAGFAAGITRRGIRFVQIPTSLLAQVDSSVGGKTGINTKHGKNLVGLFHQPGLVLADVDLLDTLPERELRAGYAEVVKYGLLGDAKLFDWLDANLDTMLAGDKQLRMSAVERSCKAKAATVSADEREHGERALLNLGHTFGHALEAATGYSGRLIHGEGVAIGMCLAFELSAALGLCPQEEPGRVAAHLARAGLPTHMQAIDGELPDADGLIALMGQDKKVQQGRLTFILARRIGQAFVTQDVPPDKLRAFLQEKLRRT